MKTITPSLDLVVDAGNYLGETPVWSPDEQILYWINCEQPPELHSWNPATKAHRQWLMPKRIGGLAPTADGALIFALSDGLYDFSPKDGALRLRAPSPFGPRVALHETCVDHQGRLWVGGYDLDFTGASLNGPDLPRKGALCRLDGDVLVRVYEGVTVSNGLAVSPDGRSLYHTDTLSGVLQRWSLDPDTGHLTTPHEFVRLPLQEGFMDGAAVDSEGGYWSVLAVAGKIHRYLPNGALDLVVDMPFNMPIKVAFGGETLDTMYLTTAALNGRAGSAKSAPIGGVFSFKPGFKGLPQPLVR
jgi:L-arabinonolactonase